MANGNLLKQAEQRFQNAAEKIAKDLIASSYKQQQTNADRIRAMSDDMLAEFIILSPEMEFDVCRLCQFGNPTLIDDRGQCLSGYGACDAESRAEAFKKWLRQPVKEE